MTGICVLVVLQMARPVLLTLGLVLGMLACSAAAPRNVTVSDNDKYVVSNNNNNDSNSENGDVELGNRVSPTT